MLCPFCGFINHEDARFCIECGSPLIPKQIINPTPPPAVSPSPPSRRGRVGKTAIILIVAISMVLIVAGIPLALSEIGDSSKRIDMATRPVSEMVLSANDLGAGWALEKVTFNNKSGSVTAIYVNPNEYQFTISMHSCSSKKVALNQVYSNFTSFSLTQARTGKVTVTNVTVGNATDSAFLEKPASTSSTTVMFSKGNIVVSVRSVYGLYGDVEDSYMLQLAAMQAGRIF